MADFPLSLAIGQFLANVNTPTDAKAQEAAEKLAIEIQEKRLKLLELVKALGDYLTAEDDLLRPKATQCLSQTLNSLGKEALTPNDLAVLSNFYASKLQDQQSIKEALFGISSLVEMSSFGPSNIKIVIKALKTDYESTKHLASTRYFGLLTLQRLFTRFEPYVKKVISEDFIETFIQVATGEKDPRNLLVSFQLNHSISSSLDIKEYHDELFDILFCYFPISFKPPKDDPYKITSDQLKDALRAGIATSALFAKDAYPNLLEKLTTTSPSVKRDTILTLTECINQYGHVSILEHWVELWNALKFEILHGDDQEDEDGIIPLTLDVFTAISLQLTSSEEDFEKFFETIWNELKDNLSMKTAIKTCTIFGAIAKGNTYTYNVVASRVLGELFRDTKDLSIPKQRTLIQNLGVFTTAYADVYGTVDAPKLQDYNNALKNFKDEILIVLGKALMGSSLVEVSLRTLAITELTKVTTLADFLINSELGLIVQYFTETVLIDDNEYVFNSGIGGLVQISKINTTALLDTTFPTLLSLLPDDDSESIRINDDDKPKEKIFNIISTISTTSEIVKFLLIRLLSKLETIQGKATVGYCGLIVSTLQDMIISSERSTPFLTDSLLSSSFTQLVKLIMNSSLDGPLADHSVIENATEILKLLVVYSSKGLHQQVLDEVVALFSGGSKDGQYINGIDSTVDLWHPTQLTNVFVKILAGLDKSVKFPDAELFVEKIVDLFKTQEMKDPYTKLTYLRLLTLLINKWTVDTSKFEDMPLKTTEDIEIYTWIAKGVILKTDPKSTVFISKLVSLLSDQEFGTVVTKSFEVIVIDMNLFDKFKKIQNNNVRLLYKQKFFQIVSPILVDGFTETSSMKVKSNYLTALSLILKHTKREIIKPHLASFFPLLLQSLSLENSDVRLASVQTLVASVDEISDLISQHLTTLIPQLLKLTKPDASNSADVRLASLNALHSFTMVVSLEKLVPYQKEIIRQLTPVLDDNKRKVRKGAVDARQAYYELGRTVD